MAITKKIIGANPVKLEVDGRETSASICWIVRTVDSDGCNVNYSDERACDTVTLTPLTCEDTTDKVVAGSITTEDGLTVNYEITQKHFDCEGSGECECSCKPLRTWTVPYYVDEDYSGDIEFYYEYYHISAGTDTICSKEKRIGHKTITTGDVGTQITIVENCEGCTVTAQTGNTIIGCQSEAGTTVNVNFNVYPSEVPSTGGTVTVICSFKKITIDESCNEIVKNGSFNLQKEVPECNLPDDECCYTHMTNIVILVNEIRSNIGIDDDVSIYYNGIKVNDNIELEIKQNSKRDENCTGGCKDKTTYCANSSSLQIWYESLYGKADWETGGKLTRHGGRIKVTWDYTAHTKTVQCITKDIKLMYEGYMEIGDCDEPFHPTEFVVLFKEQTPECTTCESDIVYECSNCNYQNTEPFSICPTCHGNDIVSVPYNKLIITPNQDDCGGGGGDGCSDFNPRIVYGAGGCSDFAPEIIYGAGGCSDFNPRIVYGAGDCSGFAPEIIYGAGGCSDFNPRIVYGAGGCSGFAPEITYNN